MEMLVCFFVSLFVCLKALHQTKGFTQLWFSMKLVFCPLCAFFLVWFAKRLTSEPTLTQK